MARTIHALLAARRRNRRMDAWRRSITARKFGSSPVSSAASLSPTAARARSLGWVSIRWANWPEAASAAQPRGPAPTSPFRLPQRRRLSRPFTPTSPMSKSISKRSLQRRSLVTLTRFGRSLVRARRTYSPAIVRVVPYLLELYTPAIPDTARRIRARGDAGTVYLRQFRRRRRRP